jgi:hypothetical protein
MLSDNSDFIPRRPATRRRMLEDLGAAAAEIDSANRITLLRESKPGSVEKHVFLRGLNSPIGMALVGNTFFLADSDAQ